MEIGEPVLHHVVEEPKQELSIVHLALALKLQIHIVLARNLQHPQAAIHNLAPVEIQHNQMEPVVDVNAVKEAIAHLVWLGMHQFQVQLATNVIVLVVQLLVTNVQPREDQEFCIAHVSASQIKSINQVV